MEKRAYVLDFLPSGWPSDRNFSREPVAIGLGEEEFKILEILIKPNDKVNPGDRLVLPPNENPTPAVDHVKRRLSYPDITTAAKSELPNAIETIVLANPAKFLRFFNEAQAITRRFHMLELLPGIGKKSMDAIVRERVKAPFASFEDLEQRVSIRHPQKLIAARIEKELSGEEEKYRVFVPR